MNILGQDDNDSQQAAEAMIQLGYYPTPQAQDESLDFDPNYDPSDFLIKKDTNVDEPMPQVQQPQYEENYDYPQADIQEGAGGDEVTQNYYGAFNQPAFNVGEFAFQQPQDEFIQPQPQQLIPPDGSALADLEISDSDDEDQNESVETPGDTSKEDDGLWF